MAKPRRELWQLSRRLKHKANDIGREINERNKPNLEILSGLSPSDLDHLTPEQQSTLQTLRQWLHDYNLGKADKPNFPPSILTLVSYYAEREMDIQVFGKPKSICDLQ
jgi:hypothetical protein